MRVHKIIKWFEELGLSRRQTACKDLTSEVCEDFRNVEQVKPAVIETPQRSVWRVFGDITKFIGIISVYIMLKFDLQLSPYKLSIMEHVKEADIANCASLAKWMTSHIDVVRTTLVFRLYLVGAS